LQYNEKAIGPGAQTERPGGAGPVRALLGRRTSPAVCCLSVLENFAVRRRARPEAQGAAAAVGYGLFGSSARAAARAASSSLPHFAASSGLPQAS